jgi:hypothetical protein
MRDMDRLPGSSGQLGAISLFKSLVCQCGVISLPSGDAFARLSVARARPANVKYFS